MFCIFIFFHISNRTDQVKESYGYCTSLSLYLSHSSLSIFIMQLEIRTEQTATTYDWIVSSKGGGYDDVEKKWWEMHAVQTPLELHVVGGRNEEQRGWADEFVSEIRNGNKVRVGNRMQFLSFSSFLNFTRNRGPIDSFAALIKYHVRLRADTFKRTKYLKEKYWSEINRRRTHSDELMNICGLLGGVRR